jgi:hypothetical protein
MKTLEQASYIQDEDQEITGNDMIDDQSQGHGELM